MTKKNPVPTSVLVLWLVISFMKGYFIDILLFYGLIVRIQSKFTRILRQPKFTKIIPWPKFTRSLPRPNLPRLFPTPVLFHWLLLKKSIVAMLNSGEGGETEGSRGGGGIYHEVVHTSTPWKQQQSLSLATAGWLLIA